MSPLFWIILLIVVGVLLFIAELILLPGITVAAVLSLGSMCAAVTWSFMEYGIIWGFIAIGVVAVISAILLAVFFKRSTWRRVTLNTELTATIERPISELCEMGAKGTTITRLSPMGKVMVDGKIFEAKTLRGLINEGQKVKVIGYDNQTIIIESIH